MAIRSCVNTPSSTGELFGFAPEGLACAHDVHGTVNAVRDGNPATEAAGVLDLHCDVKKSVAVKVAERIHRIQRRREFEQLIKTPRSQRAIRPEGNASKCVRRELGTTRRSMQQRETLGSAYLFYAVVRSNVAYSPVPAGVDRGYRPAAPNGSRLSCGRPAQRRKSGGRTSVPRQGHNTQLRLAITARQLQAHVRRHAPPSL